MICPKCKSDMFVVEYSRIELDYCPKCQGVWFDSGELELLLEPAGLESPRLFLDDILKSPEASTAEKPHRCPVCTRKMKKISIGDRTGIIIDVCRRDDGLWFDGGELEHLLKGPVTEAAGGREAQQVASFLRGVFQTPKQMTENAQGSKDSS